MSGLPGGEFPSLVRALGIGFGPEEARVRSSLEGVGETPGGGRAYVAFIGAGGKTTLMMRFAVECLLAGFWVLVTTTTKMYIPRLQDFEILVPYMRCLGPQGDVSAILDETGANPKSAHPGSQHCFSSDATHPCRTPSLNVSASISDGCIPEPEMVILNTWAPTFCAEYAERGPDSLKWLRCETPRNPLVVLGGSIEKLSTGLPKITAVDPDTLDAVWAGSLYDFILVEADGAAGRPLKAHRPWEPVIPARVTHVACVVGADAVDAPASDATVHTLAQASESWGLGQGDRLSAGIIAEMIMGNNGARSKAPVGAEFVPVINKVDDDVIRRGVLPLVRELLLRGSGRVVLTSWAAARNKDESARGRAFSGDLVEVFGC